METLHVAAFKATRPAVSDAVYSNVLLHFPELVGELAGDPATLLRAVGIDPHALASGQALVTYGKLAALLERAATTLACPDIGLRLARKQNGLAMYGPLGPVMRNSRTFGDAVRYVADHGQAHSLASRVWLKAAEEGFTFVGHDILFGEIGQKAQAIEQILLVGHLGAIELTGGAVKARRVHFRHQANLPLKTYRQQFRCDVEFGQAVDGIFFLDRDLETPVLDSDACRYGLAAAHIESVFGRDRPPLHAQVRGIILQELGTTACLAESVATDLDLHVRTLHRRLHTEGTSFQRIKDEVRRDTILYYLSRTSLDFGDISDRVGFAEQSVMTRFCRREFGAAPSVVRKITVTAPRLA